MGLMLRACYLLSLHLPMLSSVGGFAISSDVFFSVECAEERSGPHGPIVFWGFYM